MVVRSDHRPKSELDYTHTYIYIPVSSKGPEFQPDLKNQPAAETENSGGNSGPLEDTGIYI